MTLALRLPRLLTLALALCVAGPALGVDGVVEINQARALAGGVDPADDPGFPVRIGWSASYRLTSDLYVPDANTTAITVVGGLQGLHRTTLDLNGFTIRGPNECALPLPLTCDDLGTGMGVSIPSVPLGSRPSVRVVNGTIRGMGSHGISAWSADVEGVRVISNGGVGIDLQLEGRVVDSEVLQNLGGGIVADGPALVSGCHVGDNGAIGVSIAGGATVSGNVVEANADIGIGVRDSAVVSKNAVRKNGGDGIQAGAGANVLDNSVRDNTGDGIDVSSGSTVARNSVYNNEGTGLRLAADVGYADNVIVGNGAAVSAGIQIGVNLCDTAPCP